MKLITPPSIEPIDITAVEGQCRLDSGTVAAMNEEATVNLFIAAVRQRAEAVTRRALITQTWELVLDCFPSGAIELPKPPLQSVTSIKYLDTAGAEQTLDASKYKVDPDSFVGRVLPAYGERWPATLSYAGAVRIRFVCGYGATAAAVPAGIRQWMLLNVANLYEFRETIVTGTIVNDGLFKTMADALLEDFRVRTW